VVICRLKAEGRRDKGRIGCLQDRKVLRKDLDMVSSPGHLGRWFEGSACMQDDILCQPRITGHCYFQRMGI
jgi:hypothetical protein